MCKCIHTTRLRSEATLRERVSCLLRCDPSGRCHTHTTSNLSLCLPLARVAHASIGVRTRFQRRNWLRYLLFTNATGTLADSRVRVRVRTFIYMVWNDRANERQTKWLCARTQEVVTLSSSPLLFVEEVSVFFLLLLLLLLGNNNTLAQRSSTHSHIDVAKRKRNTIVTMKK